jgi:hypothetical protein
MKYPQSYFNPLLKISVINTIGAFFHIKLNGILKANNIKS